MILLIVCVSKEAREPLLWLFNHVLIQFSPFTGSDKFPFSQFYGMIERA